MYWTNDSGVETLWSSSYNAGSGIEPSMFARGSGTTPTLLGDAFVAITDNVDTQISLKIYRQAPQLHRNSQLLCSFPILCDIRAIGHAGLDVM